MKTLDQLLDHFAALGCTFKCTYDDEIDYVGTNKAEAKEALEACDEMALTILDPSGKNLGWCLIICGLGPDEQIADYTIGNPVAEFLGG
jgi:hypothetical protein